MSHQQSSPAFDCLQIFDCCVNQRFAAGLNLPCSSNPCLQFRTTGSHSAFAIVYPQGGPELTCDARSLISITCQQGSFTLPSCQQSNSHSSCWFVHSKIASHGTCIRSACSTEDLFAWPKRDRNCSFVLLMGIVVPFH